MSERLHKVLARQGVGSRRAIESMMREGRVEVNGALAQIGQAYAPGDEVRLDGELLAIQLVIEPRVLIYHKPLGELCTHDDPEGRPTIYQNLLPCEEGKWISIGRLDINSEGLLLLTNDGEIAYRQMHPSSAIVREYLTRLSKPVNRQQLNQLVRGVRLDDGPARFDQVTLHQDGRHPWYRVQVSEGRNRLVRRVWESVGVMVSRLIRIRYGDVVLPRGLKPGEVMIMDPADVMALKR